MYSVGQVGMWAVKEFWFREFQSGQENTEVSTSIRCILWEIERWCEESVYSYVRVAWDRGSAAYKWSIGLGLQNAAQHHYN